MGKATLNKLCILPITRCWSSIPFFLVVLPRTTTEGRSLPLPCTTTACIPTTRAVVPDVEPQDTGRCLVWEHTSTLAPGRPAFYRPVSLSLPPLRYLRGDGIALPFTSYSCALPTFYAPLTLFLRYRF